MESAAQIGGNVIGKAANLPSGHMIEEHRHRHGQLVYAVSGVMEVTTQRGLWLVPPMRAVWVPPDVNHKMRARGAVQLRTVYVDPEALQENAAEAPRTLSVTPLLRELILRVVAIRASEDLREIDRQVSRLLVTEMTQLMTEPARPSEDALPLPSGRDKRLAKICQAVLDDPGSPLGLEEWGNIVGASKRTMARKFQSEFGMSFFTWRQQARVFIALSRLSQGESVTSVASDLGYETLAAFSSMFRRVTGVLPSKYFSDSDTSASLGT
ncbi:MULTISPECIES: helix-turn-helix transcriptional regulator [unclassified Burkholderia]|uniref:AraC family transcriptional regulator n=1 Tax=unclassified Burkholderia TaxID=2613784 RepID=UPI002AB1072B|nr:MULTISPECIES: helix-turn-helix transcriptional regulator [unclassified Burkholderia]